MAFMTFDELLGDIFLVSAQMKRIADHLKIEYYQVHFLLLYLNPINCKWQEVYF